MKNRVKALVEQSLSSPLTQSGFKKAGDLYTRRSDGVIQMLEIQHSRWNDQNKISMTLNCGIYVPGVTSTFRRHSEPARPKLADCCITVRVGLLGASKLDTWWTLSTDDSADRDARVAEDIRSTTTSLALPFLDRFPSKDEVARFLSTERGERDEFVEPRHPSLRYAYAALLWAQLGDTGRSQEALIRAINESRNTPLEEVVARFAEAWKPRAD